VVWLTGTGGEKGSPPHKPVWSTTGETIAFNVKVAADSGAYVQVCTIDVPERCR
jgi:hypothetical protein